MGTVMVPRARDAPICAKLMRSLNINFYAALGCRSRGGLLAPLFDIKRTCFCAAWLL